MDSRYSRQVRVFGIEGQENIESSKVALFGVGGLGSIVAYYLVASGVGEIVLIDHDVVRLCDLNRQILYTTSDIGKPKIDVAIEKLKALNPSVKIKGCRVKASIDNVYELIDSVDLVIDALDNWETRLVLNKACVEKGIPLIHGAINGFYGQVMVVVPGETPCLQCIVGEPVETRKPVPAIASTVGVIGSIQVNEALKLLSRVSKPVLNKLIVYDGYRLSIEKIDVKKNPDCPVCSRI